jgi:tetratricopeptide (TPR) repeat protein
MVMKMDNKWFEDFDRYLMKEMSPEEMKDFEQALADQPELREAYDIYSAVELDMAMDIKHHEEEEALKHNLHQFSAQYFSPEPRPVAKEVKLVSWSRLKWIAGIAAGLLLYFAVNFIFENRGNQPRQMAQSYFEANLMQLGQVMSGGTDDQNQYGVSAYNQQDYAGAIAIFEISLLNDTANAETLKYIGLSHLAVGEYEKALHYFRMLADQKDLYSNPGLFYQALTLMQRNGPDDILQAQLLLERVVEQDAEGSRQAKEWLGKF